ALWQDVPDEGGAYSRLVAAVTRAGLAAREHVASPNWYLPCQGMSYLDYLASRGAKRRTKWLYERRRLEKMAGVDSRIHTQAGPELETAIADYYAVYGKSWKASEPYPGFHAGLMRMAASQGWLRLGILRFDGQPVAAQLWLVYGGKASIVKV